MKRRTFRVKAGLSGPVSANGRKVVRKRNSDIAVRSGPSANRHALLTPVLAKAGMQGKIVAGLEDVIMTDVAKRKMSTAAPR